MRTILLRPPVIRARSHSIAPITASTTIGLTRLPFEFSAPPSCRHLVRSFAGLPLDDGCGQFSIRSSKHPPPGPGFGGPHDVGGVEELLGRPLDTSERDLLHWETQTHALLVMLVSKGLLTVDELRRGIEALYPVRYESWGYYEKWAVSMATALLERGVITSASLDTALGDASEGVTNDASESPLPLYAVGDVVRVKREDSASRWRKPHLRTPGYIFGVPGHIESYAGEFNDPFFGAFRSVEQAQHLYRVRFRRADVWPEAEAEGEGTRDDTLDVEIYESWLEAVEDGAGYGEEEQAGVAPMFRTDERYDDHSHGHDHTHEHGHGHDDGHGTRLEIEQAALDREGDEQPGQRVAAALVRLLVHDGADAHIAPAEMRAAIEATENAGTAAEGARLVARAWVDDGFRARLLADASSAAAEIGINATNSTTKTKLKAVGMSADEHHLVVCTLCSCYPISILGLSPSWYKSRSFRARAVREPRAMLRDSFGLDVPEDVAVRVHDSTADLRYIVLPNRPAGTEGWSEEDLARLVTRDTMIGVAVPEVVP